MSTDLRRGDGQPAVDDGRVNTRERLSLAQFIEARLGKGGREQARNWFMGTFGAGSFSEFWRCWNPLYGYLLYYYSYRPLRRFLPRAAAMVLTFLACGFFLHDLVGWIAGHKIQFPEMTVAFALFAVGMVVSEGLHMDLSRWPLPLRALVNVSYVAGSVLVATRLHP